MNGTILLVTAAGCSFTASLLHVAIIFGGANWYRFFGAGENMAKLAENASIYPTIVTFIIASILSIWGLYALSGAGLMPKFPLLKTALVVITSIYLVRGVAGLTLPFIFNHPMFSQNSKTFWLVSSLICLLIGLTHLLGTVSSWRALSN